MDKELIGLWKTILGEIEIEISRANFLTLFKNTSLMSLKNDTAVIATPSVIAIDLLQKRFSAIIKKALDKHTHKNISVVFLAKSPKMVNQKGVVGPLFDKEEKDENEKPQVARQFSSLSRVRPDFLFETMAVSPSNQLAYVSAQTVAKNLGRSYNPLFIYGPVGVGKTHLMQAIANEVYKKSTDKKIIYTTSEEFTNEVVEAIRGNDTARMKRRFRTVDLLLIDDVQFIAGKDRVQEELFHTFNILIDNASQVVLSSDRPPSEIAKLEKRLSSRFSAGLTVDIEQPDFELRTAILLIKAKKYGFDLPIEVAKVIAEKISDVRSLEGILLRLITETKTLGGDISIELTEKILNGKNKNDNNRLHSDEVIKRVCAFFDIKPTLIKSPKRNAYLVRARQVIMYFLKKELGLSFVEIGNLLGGRDHTTIMYGVEKMEKIISSPSSKNNVSLDIVGINKVLFNQNVNQ